MITRKATNDLDERCNGLAMDDELRLVMYELIDIGNERIEPLMDELRFVNDAYAGYFAESKPGTPAAALAKEGLDKYMKIRNIAYEELIREGIDPIQIRKQIEVKKSIFNFKGESGWYQDIDGRLYNYDGVVWDVVPECKLDELEYLG